MAEEARKRTIREARRAVEQAELLVAEREKAVEALVNELEDPDLYSSPDGTRRATELGSELAKARSRLESAVQEWADAEERASALVS